MILTKNDGFNGIKRCFVLCFIQKYLNLFNVKSQIISIKYKKDSKKQPPTGRGFAQHLLIYYLCCINLLNCFLCLDKPYIFKLVFLFF